MKCRESIEDDGNQRESYDVPYFAVELEEEP